VRAEVGERLLDVWTMSRPVVSVIIPALNEEPDIAGCVHAIRAQSYPAGLIEVILVDGCSRDRTVPEALAAADGSFRRFDILENARRRTSTSLNLGLEVAKGDVIVRVDARSRIEPHYIARCVEVLQQRRNVGVVGGAQVAWPRSGGVVDLGIARALRNRWGTGLSRYRRAQECGTSDTVWLGAFRADELRQLGGWSEEVALNEDWELNARYRKAGMLVWFDSSLRSGYLPRRSVGAVTYQHFRFGRVKGTWWARGQQPAPRHVALVLGPPLLGSLVRSAARRAGWPRVVVLGAAAAMAVEASGTREPRAGTLSRAVAAVTLAGMAAGWWSGVVVGLSAEALGLEHRDG
jgi:glycosyltransferase involved in cell wall biosynthesis